MEGASAPISERSSRPRRKKAKLNTNSDDMISIRNVNDENIIFSHHKESHNNGVNVFKRVVKKVVRPLPKRKNIPIRKQNIKKLNAKVDEKALEDALIPHDKGSHWLDLFYQPIKDLADNWSIDLEEELNAYMEQLIHIQKTFGTENEQKEVTLYEALQPDQINFAEAAIVVQGSALIYSKKVEFFYQKMFEALDALLAKHSKANKKRKPQMETADEAIDPDVSFSAPMSREGHIVFEYLELNDELCPDEMITLQEEEHEDAASPLFRMKKFLAKTASKWSFYMKTHVGKGRKSFALLNSFIDESGFMYLDEEDVGKLSVTDNAMRGALQIIPETGPIDFNMTEENVLPQKEFQPQDPVDVNDFPDFESDFGGADQDFDKDAGELKHDVKIRKSVIDPLSEMLDPYDDSASRTTHHPFKKGKPFTYLSESAFKKAKYNFDLSSLILKEPFRLESSGRVPAVLFKPFFREFEKYVKRPQRVAPAARPTNEEIDVGVLADDHQVFEILRGDFDDFAEKGHLNQTDNAYIDGFHYELDPAAYNDDDYSDGLGIDMDDDINIETQDHLLPSVEALPQPKLEQSYEDLCRTHVEEYIKRLEGFGEQSDISRRVRQWENRVIPALEEEASHPVFDIKECGYDLIHRIEKQADGHSDEQITVPFVEAISGLAQFEICRYFLTTLQLANNGNIALQGDEELQSLNISLLDSAINDTFAAY